MDDELNNKKNQQEDGEAFKKTQPPSPKPTPEKPGLDPTRYGDWEKNGRCIDF